MEDERRRLASRRLRCGDILAGTASCRIGVEGVDELHGVLQPLGILHPNAQLADQPWGTRDFGVLDPDNNLITFFERR